MRKKVVILGAGFGGLEACKQLAQAPVDITLVDRSNHHLFQPLLYQVATAGLSAIQIAHPIRAALADQKNVTVLMDQVLSIDAKNRTVELGHGIIPFDYLVIALGARTSYFGRDEWAQHTIGLKSLEDALSIRSRVLHGFEQAETETDANEQRRLMTVAIVGGGPTGVELAGAFAELSRHVLKKDFRRIAPEQARVVLIEAAPRLLPPFHPDLSENARQELIKLGVEVRTNAKVEQVGEGYLKLAGETLHAHTIIWAAGVAAQPVTQSLGVPLDRAGRIMVNPDLTVAEHSNIFAIGDIAHCKMGEDKMVPGVSPAALQMGKYSARCIALETQGKARPAQPFQYFDKGSMATIGRSAAVAQIANLRFTGFVAWMLWLAVHLFFLIGFRNKVIVLIEWLYAYMVYKRGARIVLGSTPRHNPETQKPTQVTAAIKAD